MTCAGAQESTQVAGTARSGVSRHNRSAAPFILFFTVIHTGLAFKFPLAADETYYWEWSRHLDWGYYDQGPMIAWWIKAFCLIFGNTVLGIRSGIIVASAITLVFSYLLARDLLGPR